MLTWALLRSVGIVSLGLLSLSVFLGVAGPLIRRPERRLVAIGVHRTAAAVGMLLIAAHVVLAVIDSWVEVSAWSVVIPGVSAWEPVWIGLGALAVDLMAVIAVTSALRGRMPRAWWGLHRLAYPAWALSVIHALAIGSDRSSPVMLAIAGGGVLAVALAAIARVVTSDVPVGPQPARRPS